MGSKSKVVLAVAGMTLLAGCKTEVGTHITLSEMNDAEIRELPGVVRLEVPSCNDYNDSRKPSDSLVRAQEAVPRIFPDAEFIECYRQRMDTWAEFSIPVAVTRNTEGNYESDSTVNFLIPPDGGTALSVSVPEGLNTRLIEAGKADLMIRNLDLSFSFVVENDTDAPQRFLRHRRLV